MTKLAKKKQLEEQMKRFHGYHQAIMQVKDNCDERLSNTNIDSSARSLLIGKEIRNITSRDMDLNLVTQPDIKMVYDSNSLPQLLGSFIVHGCDAPNPPKLKVVDLTFDSIEVEWRDDLAGKSGLMDQMAVQYYEFSYAVAKNKKSKKKAEEI